MEGGRRARKCRVNGTRAFSLVEMLVVIAVIGILIAMVFKGGSVMLDRSRHRDTEALFGMLNQAIDSFYADKPYARNREAMERYGGYPPDELSVFDATAPCPIPRKLVNPAGGNPAIVPTGLLNLNDAGTHQDVRALALAIRLRSPKAATILDGIPDRFTAVDDAMYCATQEEQTNKTGTRLTYYVDAWGVPIEYYSTRLAVPSTDAHAAFAAWAMQKSGGRPVLVSYGANGADQWEAASADPNSVIADVVGQGDGVINHPFNDDNVYSPEAFADRVRR